jgi:hypothetical protein
MSLPSHWPHAVHLLAGKSLYNHILFNFNPSVLSFGNFKETVSLVTCKNGSWNFMQICMSNVNLDNFIGCDDM